jgi:polar amino acid transport system permease protein
MNYDWNFGRLEPYARAFFVGSGTTLLLTAIVVAAGTLIGVGLALIMRDTVIRRLAYPFIDVLRALPPLVLLLFLYYLLTEQVIGTSVSAFWIASLGLSLNLAAFVADLVRAALENVDPDSVDAGLALGMTDAHATRYVVFPHVMREVIPGLTVLYIGMLKATSLAAIINVREVVYTATTVIADISRSLEAWTVVACIYVALVVPASYGARLIERRLGRGFALQQAAQ